MDRRLTNLIDEIICGDSLEVVSSLPDESIDACIIDPPYGERMGYSGDNGLREAKDLLGEFLKQVVPKLKRCAHIAVFWTMRNLDSAIDTVRQSGLLYRRTLSMYIPKGSARPYLGWLPRTQAILVTQKYLPKPPSEFHCEMAQYMKEKLEQSSLSKTQIAKELGCDSRLVMKWTRPQDPSWCLPTPRFYPKLKQLLKLDDRYDVLLWERETGQAPARKDFEYKHDTYIVDYEIEDMFHPSQKPLPVLEHMVSCLAPKGGIVLDGFGGSGTTALACQKTGRRFILVELDPDYCEIARKRLSIS